MARPTRTDAPPSAQRVGPTTETPMLPTTRARATAILAALSLSALLVLPGVALADATTPAGKGNAGTTVAGPSQLPGTAADRAHEATSQPPSGPPANDGGTGDGTDGSTGDVGDGSTGDVGDGSTGDVEDGSTGDVEDGSGTGPADEEAPLTACAPHLVTFSRDGSDGDDTAVALTSQAMDATQPGWLHVSWETAAGTQLDSVQVLSADGNRRALPATATGTVFDIVEVTFCGRTDGTVRALEDRDAAAQDAGAAGTAAPRAEDAGDTLLQQPATTAVTTAAPVGDTVPPAGGASADNDPTGNEEVEVLGIQIVAPERDTAAEASEDRDASDDEPTTALAAAPALAGASSGSGGMHPLLLAAAIAAGLAGAVTVLRSTSRATTSSTTQGDLS